MNSNIKTKLDDIFLKEQMISSANLTFYGTNWLTMTLIINGHNLGVAVSDEGFAVYENNEKEVHARRDEEKFLKKIKVEEQNFTNFLDSLCGVIEPESELMKFIDKPLTYEYTKKNQ